MSTRATIRFTGERGTFHVYRHYDGTPQNVFADLKKTLHHHWNYESNADSLATCFLREHDSYLISNGIHGDESHVFECRWCDGQFTHVTEKRPGMKGEWQYCEILTS